MPAVWVLRNLSFKNTDNPVIRALVHGNGGQQMVAALEFLKALQEFEEEEKNGTARQAMSNPPQLNNRGLCEIGEPRYGDFLTHEVSASED